MKSWLLTFAIVAFVVWKQAPVILNNLKFEGIRLPSNSYPLIQASGKDFKISFPPPNSQALAIFWATWCGPCKLEMSRLEISIQEGKIPKESVFAINPFESTSEVKKFLSSNNYSFTFIDASDIVQFLKIQVTPTTLFIDKGEITSMSSGLSLIGIWKAESFL